MSGSSERAVFANFTTGVKNVSYILIDLFVNIKIPAVDGSKADILRNI